MLSGPRDLVKAPNRCQVTAIHGNTRLEVKNGRNDTKTLEPFAEWVQCAELDHAWSMRQLLFVAEQGTNLLGNYGRDLGGYLVNIAREFPTETATLLARIIENSQEHWEVYSIVEDIKKTVEILVDSDLTAANRLGKGIAEMMFEREFPEFRSIVETR